MPRLPSTAQGGVEWGRPASPQVDLGRCSKHGARRRAAGQGTARAPPTRASTLPCGTAGSLGFASTSTTSTSSAPRRHAGAVSKAHACIAGSRHHWSPATRPGVWRPGTAGQRGRQQRHRQPARSSSACPRTWLVSQVRLQLDQSLGAAGWLAHAQLVGAHAVGSHPPASTGSSHRGSRVR